MPMSSALSKLRRKLAPATLSAQAQVADTNQSFWNEFHVDAPEQGFPSVEASLHHYDWRNRLYPGYIELMPVDAAHGFVVLDYGCGPGNDVIGFGHYSRPKKIYAADISETAMALAARRAKLHGIDVEFIRIDQVDTRLPLETASVDLIHSSGVLHHTPNPQAILNELRRVLRPEGYCQIMVYHYHSIWMHLFVAYHKLVKEAKFQSLSLRDAFTRTTDTTDTPIAECYTAEAFAELVRPCGFACEFLGASMSVFELKQLPSRFDALEDIRLNAESRKFLCDLTFDTRHWPQHQGRVAGINACFRLRPI